MPRLATCGCRALCVTPAKPRMALIKELRALTSAPMKNCVSALKESGGDLEEAVVLLRKSGLAAAKKKATRGADEGAIALAHGPDGLAVVEISSETDFVARNEIFQRLAVDVARTALAQAAPAAQGGAVDVLETEVLGASALAGGATSVSDALGHAVGTLGENLVLRRACVLRPAPEGGALVGYVHNSYSEGVGRTAAAVSLRSATPKVDELRALGQKLAMHVVASKPAYLDRAAVPEAVLARERDIFREQAAAEYRESGKPQKMVDHIVEGRLKKLFYSEACLLEQEYVIEDSAGSVAKVLQAAGAELGAEVSLEGFVRYHIGEGAAAKAEGAADA